MTNETKAERAARAMGWWFDVDGKWGWFCRGFAHTAPCAPDLTDDRFVMAMLRFLDGREGRPIEGALIAGNVDWLEPVSDWPDLLADAVIAEGES